MALSSRKGQPAPSRAAKAAPKPVSEPEPTAAPEPSVLVVEPALAPITLDAWAEQMRRDLNTFVGCQRIARIQGGDTVRSAQPSEWLERFEAWKTAANV